MMGSVTVAFLVAGSMPVRSDLARLFGEVDMKEVTSNK